MNWLKLTNTVLLALIVIFQLQAWYGKGSMEEIDELKIQIAELDSKLKSMRIANDILSANILDLKYGSEAAEEVARDQLGLIKEGEVFYFVAKTP